MPLMRWAAAAGTGAALAYFFDPDQGRRRRTQARDQLTAKVRRPVRRTQDKLDKEAEWMRDRTTGLLHEAVRTRADVWPENDQELIDKVRSEVLGREEWRGYTINVDAAGGAVSLRGQVDRAEQIRALSKQLCDVAGVGEVHSFLHLPDTPPPNKAEVMRASSRAEQQADQVGDAIE